MVLLLLVAAIAEGGLIKHQVDQGSLVLAQELLIALCLQGVLLDVLLQLRLQQEAGATSIW